MRTQKAFVVIALIVVALAAGCGRNKKPVVTAPQPAPTLVPPTETTPPAPPQRVDESVPLPQPRLNETDIANRSLDDLNRNSPLKPIFFLVDSADLDESGRAVATANADVLKKYSSWAITIEGHCDERGTAEYNLALGERRASAVRAYLASLGISAERMKTVSYGKEYPFDMGHSEEAWAKNRRGHLVITSK